MSGNIPKVESIFIRGEGGSIFKLDLPLHESIEERLLKGYIVRVANAKGDAYVETADGSLLVERPAVSAQKKTWVGWAVAESTRRGNPITPDDAEALTRDDLIERYGTDPVTQTPEQIAEAAKIATDQAEVEAKVETERVEAERVAAETAAKQSNTP